MKLLRPGRFFRFSGKTAFILFMIFIAQTGFSADYKFDHLKAEDGLAGNSISSIIQDKRGFIWFGTQDGLNRYDGKEFLLFEHKPFDKNTIRHNVIQTMFYDKEKDLIWLGSYGGLSSFNPENFEITHYPLSKIKDSKKKFSRVIVSIAKDSSGTLWIGTLSGLISLVPETGEIREYTKDNNNDFSLPDNTVRDILTGRDGKIWVATYGGLSYIKGNRFIQITASDMNGMFPSNYLMDIEEISPGRYLVASWDGGISLFDETEKKITTVKFPDNRFYFVRKDNDGHIWAGTWGGGVYYSENTESLLKSEYKLLKNDKNNIYSISNNIGYSFLHDDSGLIWIGTNGGGVNRLNPEISDFRFLYSSADRKSSISDERIKSLLIDNNSNLWVGSYSSGVFIKNIKTGKFSRFVSDKNDASTLSSNFINIIYNDSLGDIWIGTNDGISRYVSETGKIERYYHDGEKIVKRKNHEKAGPGSVPEIVYGFFEDKNGNYWIGTYTNGVYIWDKKSGKTEHLHPDGKSKITDQMVFDINDDKFGNVWIATNYGLNRYDIKTGEIKFFLYDADDPLGVSSNTFIKIFKDSKGDLWLGTTCGGLSRYDYVTEKFIHYTKENGLLSNNVTGIAEDKKGNILVSTHKGISEINRESGIIFNLTTRFGLSGQEFKGDIITDEKGDIYISSSGAVYKIDRNLQDLPVFNPQVHINSFKVNNIEYDFGEQKSIFDSSSVNLSWKDNSFSFNFVSLDYTSPRNNRYEYMLDGFDKDWISSGNRNYANYTNIPPGRYTFRVRGSNSCGNWSLNESLLKITVDKPPFLSVYAFFVYATAAFIIFYSVIMISRGRESVKRLKEENRLKNELIEVNSELDRLVRIDPLTGVFNRLHFRETLDNGWQLHERLGVSISLIMTDIDFFKNYNDTYGHMAGDECLKKFSSILANAVSRKTDSVFRYGGEEFIIILIDTDLEGATIVADKIMKTLEASEIPHKGSSVSTCLTASIGIVSTENNDYKSPEEILSEVDRKLYRAKEHGRNIIIC